MINSVKITAEPQHKFNYLRELSRDKDIENLYAKLSNGITFKPGLNVLIGKNGSGKSTVMNIIRTFNMCNDWFCPKFMPGIYSDTLGKVDDLLDLIDCFDVVGDYRKPVFNLYRMMEDHKALSNNDVLSSRESVTVFMGGMEESKGQNQMGDFNQLMHTAYESQSISVLDLVGQNVDRYDRLGKIGDYYLKHQEESQYYTTLLDEPDCGLDVDNLDKIYDYLFFMSRDEHKNSQVICSLHNVALIKKLNKFCDVNWIEMSEGYLRKIEQF